MAQVKEETAVVVDKKVGVWHLTHGFLCPGAGD